MAATNELGLQQFLMIFSGWRILTDLFMIAVASGVYIVPLYTIMQHDSPPEHRARIIAANNVVNAIYMVVSAIVTVGLFEAGFSIPDIFLLMSVLNAGVALYIRRI